jgi:hypothetical protein
VEIATDKLSPAGRSSVIGDADDDPTGAINSSTKRLIFFCAVADPLRRRMCSASRVSTWWPLPTRRRDRQEQLLRLLNSRLGQCPFISSATLLAALATRIIASYTLVAAPACASAFAITARSVPK